MNPKLLAKLLLVGMTLSFVDAKADFLCQRKNDKKNLSAIDLKHSQTRVQAVRIIKDNGTCPRGFRKVGSIVSNDQVRQIAQDVASVVINSANAATPADVGSAIDGRLKTAIPYVTYDLRPVKLVGGDFKGVLSGFARLLPNGSWETRIIVRRPTVDTTDLSLASLSTSQVACDSGWVQGASGSTCRINGVRVSGSTGYAGSFFDAPPAGLIFPIIRAAIFDNANRATACAQSSLDGAANMTFSSINARDGICPATSDGAAIPSASPTVVPSVSPTVVPSASPSVSASPRPSSSVSPSVSATASPSPITSATPRPSASVVASVSPTATATPRPSSSGSPSASPTAVVTTTTTATPRPSASVVASVSPTATATPRPSVVASVSPTATATPRPSVVASVSPTATATPRPTASGSPVASASAR